MVARMRVTLLTTAAAVLALFLPAAGNPLPAPSTITLPSDDAARDVTPTGGPQTARTPTAPVGQTAAAGRIGVTHSDATPLDALIAERSNPPVKYTLMEHNGLYINHVDNPPLGVSLDRMPTLDELSQRAALVQALTANAVVTTAEPARCRD